MSGKRILLLSLILSISATLFGQKQAERIDTTSIDTVFYQSVYNLRPVLLKKNKILVNTRFNFPRFYKMYILQQNKIAKVPPYIVLNEFYFDTYFTYGYSDKINIYTVIPIADIHHYSPMGVQKGVGFGDVQLGATYQITRADTGKNFLSGELKITFPTGKTAYSMQDYPTGLGSFRFMAVINGLTKFENFNLWYTGYYEYRTNHSGITAGDETGLFITIQKPFNLNVGNFGIEYGLNGYYNFSDKKSGTQIPNTQDFAVNLYFGGWYKYLDKFYIRFGVPYTVFQNNAWLTKYNVMIQLDYLLK